MIKTRDRRSREYKLMVQTTHKWEPITRLLRLILQKVSFEREATKQGFTAIKGD